MAARLPDSRSLGALPSAQSGRQIASVDLSGYAKGAEARARGLQALGQGIRSFGNSMQGAAEREQAQTDALQAAQATSQWNITRLEAEAGLDQDNDYASMVDRHVENITKQREAILSGISNPRVRERFDISTADDLVRTRIAADKRAKALEGDHQIAWLSSQEDKTIGLLVENQNQEDRAKGIEAHRELIRSYADRRFMSHKQAEAWDQKFRETYAKSDALARARRGDIDGVIGDLEAAALNSQFAPVRPTPQPSDRRSEYTPEQMEAIRGRANVARVSDTWGNPDAPDFSQSHLSTFTLKSGKQVTVNKVAAQAFEGFLNELEESGYQIRDVGSYNNRNIRGSNRKSQHAFGNAIDINPDANPHTHSLKTDLPPNVSEMAAKYGLSWGGDWKGKKDAMHFEFAGVQPAGKVQVASNDPGFVPSAEGSRLPANEGTQVAQAGFEGPRKPPTIYDVLPPLEREGLLKQMYNMREQQQRDTVAAQTKASVERREQYERRMLDASVGKAILPPREEIEADDALSPPHKNDALRQWGVYAKEHLAFKNAFDRFSRNEPFNPYDREDRKNADRLFQGMGGDDPSLTAVIQRTGVMPETAATKMRADLISNDPKRIIGSMTRASNALTMNQNIMAGVDGGEDLEKNAVKFRTLVDDFGMTAEEAAARMIRDQTPEFKSSVNAKIKSEDIDQLIKKKVGINDLSGQFDQSVLGIMPNPTVGYSVRQRDALFDQYASLVKEHYLDTAGGDLDLAKKLAARQVAKTWGVSSVNGSSTLMQYPPERAPAYHGIENISERIGKQAVEAIKAEAGQDVDPKNIRLSPMPGLTAQAYKSGQVPSYALSWVDGNGVLQMLKPGRAFQADPEAMKAAQQKEREEGMAAAIRARDEEQRMKDTDPARNYIGKPIEDFIKGTTDIPNRDVRPLDKLPLGDTLGTVRQRKMDNEAAGP